MRTSGFPPEDPKSCGRGPNARLNPTSRVNATDARKYSASGAGTLEAELLTIPIDYYIITVEAKINIPIKISKRTMETGWNFERFENSNLRIARSRSRKRRPRPVARPIADLAVPRKKFDQALRPSLPARPETPLEVRKFRDEDIRTPRSW
jgi:hypothetical protein